MAHKIDYTEVEPETERDYRFCPNCENRQSTRSYSCGKCGKNLANEPVWRMDENAEQHGSAVTSANPPNFSPSGVVITGIEMSFGKLVGFFVKAALAAIPAVIIVTIVIALTGGIVASLIAGFLGT